MPQFSDSDLLYEKRDKTKFVAFVFALFCHSLLSIFGFLLSVKFWFQHCDHMQTL